MKSAMVDSLPEINQFIDGLKLHGFLDVIRHYPFEARCLFEIRDESSLNAEMLDLLFQLEFSTEGSNRRMKEEAIAVNFSRFLDEVEAGIVKCTLEDPLTNEKSEVTLLLSDILQFVTGPPVIPITGFHRKLKIIFSHVGTDRMLEANACGPQLCFPVSDVLQQYESFKHELTSCIYDSPGFGNL